jgi:hypothetical protein
MARRRDRGPAGTRCPALRRSPLRALLTCRNWLRYGIQPKNARPDLVPGLCRGKAHRFENRGYAGRRVLVSGKSSGKTLSDHRATAKRGYSPCSICPQTVANDYKWERVSPADADHTPPVQRLLHIVGDRAA